MGTEPEKDRSGSGVRKHFLNPEPDPDLNFCAKAGSGFGFGMNGMMYIECTVYKSMAEMGTELDPELDSESKIRRLIGSGFGVLVFGAGSGFGFNFSDSAHLWFTV